MSFADTPDKVDRLTKQWLDTERQITSLESNWIEQEPILEQRFSLLEAEKAQLQEILKKSDSSQDDVDIRRSELLKQQAGLESEQRKFTVSLDHLLIKMSPIYDRLPDPVKQGWDDEQAVLAEGGNVDTEVKLQVALAKLSSLADFNSRISVHETAVAAPDGSNVMVKQFYLGAGAAWFVNADGRFSGIGRAIENNWQWSFDGDLAVRAGANGIDSNERVEVNSSEIAKAIAIFEKREQADFVHLPFMIGSHENTAFDTVAGAEEARPDTGANR